MASLRRVGVGAARCQGNGVSSQLVVANSASLI